MANDVVSRNKNGNSAPFLLLVPIAFIAIVFLVGIGSIKYHEIKFKIISKEIYTEALDSAGLETTELMKNFIIDKYVDHGYNADDITIHIVQKESSLVLFSYYTYNDYLTKMSNIFSTFMDKLKNGWNGNINTKGSRVYLCSLNGYYDEHKETVIEDYALNGTTEADIEEDEDSSAGTIQVLN